jgi:hypothetical protein
MRVERTLGRTRDGGSCAECDDGYCGAPYANRGYRVLASSEPGVVEPFNLCPECYESHMESRL